MDEQFAATVMARAEMLGAISEEDGRLTRRSLTPALRRANEAVAGWMRAAHMTVYEDSVGNLIGTYPANRSAAKSFVIGSHLDTVRDAGKYDGPLGVLVGLAAVERLAAAGRRLPFAVEVVAFCDEEGLRFGTSFLGSRTLAGNVDPATLALTDEAGVSVAEAIRAFGGDPDLIAQDARRSDELLGYLEVHIEQGPRLQERNLPVGIVTAITGITRLQLGITGMAGHAGTVPMALRRDALAGAAELVLAIEAIARRSDGLVATVGQITVMPGASNVIPGTAMISLDLRHQDDSVRRQAVNEVMQQAKMIAAERNLDLTLQPIAEHAAVPMAEGMRAKLAAAIGDSGYELVSLPSGAGHDAAVLAEITPAAMLFVRCKDGISHNPAEAVTAADVAAAIAVVSRFLDKLATP
ncbi:MAG: allantoate amidohydrolase [Oscillochloris sp.]|nr:allantoate amidohydrolase [Oscillochloris sp.]